MPEFPTPPPPLALPLAPSFSRFPPPPDLPSLPTDANFRRRILPKSAAAGASSSPYLVAPVEAKNVPEKGRYWPWDPGIFKAGDDGKPFPPPVKLIYGVPLKSRFSLCSPCLRDDECWFSAKDDRSVVKSGHWEVKYLKDVVSSIPSTPPNKPKHMNRIWMSMALPWPHLSYLGQMSMSMSMDGDDHAAASLLLNHTYLYQEKTMEEMKQSLVLAIQLQQTRLKSRDQQILQLKHQLAAAIKDRDEAELNCRKALFEKLLLQHQLKHSLLPSHPNSAVDGFSSDNSIVSKPEFPVEIKGPLPEKGRFLQAVRNSGPLLETLLLAGPLPQWRHPPPPLHPCQIPPPPLQPQILHEDGNNVKRWARNRITRKRGLGDGPFEFDRSEESKHRRSLMFLQ